MAFTEAHLTNRRKVTENVTIVLNPGMDQTHKRKGKNIAKPGARNVEIANECITTPNSVNQKQEHQPLKPLRMMQIILSQVNWDPLELPEISSPVSGRDTRE